MLRMYIKDLLYLLENGYHIKCFLSATRIKCCRIEKGNTIQERILNPRGYGEGSTTEYAIKNAVLNFNQPYTVESLFGDTNIYSYFDLFLNTGYSMFIWIDGSHIIVQVRNDKWYKIPFADLLKIEESEIRFTSGVLVPKETYITARTLQRNTEKYFYLVGSPKNFKLPPVT